MRHLLFTSFLAITCLSLSTGCKSKPEIKEEDPLISDAQIAAPTNDSTAQTKLASALKSIEAQEWRSAAGAYRKAIEANPGDWVLHMERAIMLSKANEFSAAITSLQLALDSGGEREWIVWYNLGNIYQNRGMYYESVQAYRVALGLDRDANMDVLVNLSSSYLFLGQFEKAQATISHILSLDPSEVRALHNSAMVLHLQRKHDEALIAYDNVLSMYPDYPQTLFNKGHVLSMLSRYAESARAYERYIEVDPEGTYVERARTRADDYKKR